MALVNAYCTVDELRDYLKDSGDRLDESLLERAINAASRAIDKHCSRRFWQDSAATQRTYVPRQPYSVFVDDISTRTDLVVKTGTDGVNFPTTLSSSSYILEPRNADVADDADKADPHAFWQIRLIPPAFFYVCGSLPTVEVTARFGWSAVPYEVQQATLLKAASLFKRKDAPFGVAGFNEFGPVRVTRADADVMDLLSPYEIPGFA